MNLLERMRAQLRVYHYAIRTEDTYLHWVKQYVFPAAVFLAGLGLGALGLRGHR